MTIICSRLYPFLEGRGQDMRVQEEEESRREHHNLTKVMSYYYI